MRSESVSNAAVLQDLQTLAAVHSTSINILWRLTIEGRSFLNTQLTAYLTDIRRFKSQEDGLMTIHLCLETMEIIILIFA